MAWDGSHTRALDIPLLIMTTERHTNSMRDLYAYRYEPEYMHMFARLFWRILLSASVLVVIVASVYGLSELFSVLRDTGEVAGTGTGRSVPTLDRARLQNTLDAFHARAALFESLKTSTSTVADPSR